MASSSETVLSTTFPPDIDCFAKGYWIPEIFEQNNCSVTGNMLNFLNLTGPDVMPYLTVFCLNPPSDDICPFGFCPNPDIAGPLVRIANYVTGFCLAILIFYSPARVKAAFWSQSLITYSLLITCATSLLQGSLTRFHAVILVSLVCSPVNVYFAGYSIRAFWSSHRLDAALGKQQYARRAMVLLSVGIWVAVLIYAYLPHAKFAQDSCRGSTIAEGVFLGAPFLFAWALAVTGSVGLLVAFLMIPILVVIAWIAAIARRRKEIWPPGEPYRPRFGKVWRTVVSHYPFLQFWSVIAIPTVYWIGIVEIGVLDSQDVIWSLTFGQVLAVFMAVPPIIEVSHSAPKLWRWLINLTWVRFITGRPAPEPPGPEELGTPNVEFIDWQNGEKKGTVDSESDLVADQRQPRLGKTQHPDRSKGVSEHDTLLGDHGDPSVIDLSAPSPKP